MRNAHIFRVSNENEYEQRILIETWPTFSAKTEFSSQSGRIMC